MKTCLHLIWWAEHTAFLSCWGEGSGILFIHTPENRQVNFGAPSRLKILEPLIWKQPRITRPCFLSHRGLHCLLLLAQRGGGLCSVLPSQAVQHLLRGVYFLFLFICFPDFVSNLCFFVVSWSRPDKATYSVPVLYSIGGHCRTHEICF